MECKACQILEAPILRDMHGNEIKVGDRIQSVLASGFFYVLRFGWHTQYCQRDGEWELGLGFYCEACDTGDVFPIGQLSEWAEKEKYENLRKEGDLYKEEK